MKFPAASVLVVLFLTGCASNEPTPEMRAWIGKQLAEKQKLEAENERLKTTAKADAEWANLQARIAAHKTEILAELTKIYEPSKQRFLDASEVNGRAVEFYVSDVLLHRYPAAPEKPVMMTSHILIWKKTDGSGGLLRLVLAVDLSTNAYTYAEVSDRHEFTREQFAEYAAQRVPTEIKASPALQPSAWAPTQETVNTGYQAAIKVAAAAAGAVIVNILSSN